MTRMRERCLVSFIIMAIFGVVQLHFIVLHPRGPQPSPCPRRPGILWVRDPDSCFHYYMCVNGEAIHMPPCSDKMVWSVRASNCVPEKSRWDDCNLKGKMLHPSFLQPLPHPTPLTSDTLRTSPSEDKDARLSRILPHKLKRLYLRHPCSTSGQDEYLPHPGNCHWFYNCSALVTGDNQNIASIVDPEGWDAFTSECPYPQLFSDTAFRCQNYSQVDCGKRQLQLDPCDYREHQCKGAHCQPCHLRHGSCKGMEDGLQPYPGREWTPRHLLCQDQRAMQQVDCPNDSPIFSPDTKRCENLLDIPKAYGGYQPSCIGRHDGRYPADSGRCEIYYECADAELLGRYQCPKGTIFDPLKQFCRRKTETDFTSLCGENVTSGIEKLSVSVSLCQGQEDGLYADPFGRCSLYYECKRGMATQYQRCAFGSFDSRSQECQMDLAGMAAPCGEQPNPCQNLRDGQYHDLSLYCQGYFRCRHHVVTRIQTCPSGTVYNEGKGRCYLPDDTPPPCGLAPSCNGKADGRYPSPLKGCGVFFICQAGIFQGYGRCTVEEGGFYFNPETRSCDFPQNVCPPCGIRTSNCTVIPFS